MAKRYANSARIKDPTRKDRNRCRKKNPPLHLCSALAISLSYVEDTRFRVHALNRHARLIGRLEQRDLGAKALVEDRQTNTVSSTGNSRARGASPEGDISTCAVVAVQSVDEPLCALVSTTDRWDIRLGGLDGRKKSAQDQPGVLTSQRSGQRSCIHDCHVDRANSRALSGACCGMWCSTCLRHHARTAPAAD